MSLKQKGRVIFVVPREAAVPGISDLCMSLSMKALTFWQLRVSVGLQLPEFKTQLQHIFNASFEHNW